MITIEVFYKKDPQHPTELARVLYGPFTTKDAAKAFFDEGVLNGFFNVNHYVYRTINNPSYDPNFKES
jgi:hypothetical protein